MKVYYSGNFWGGHKYEHAGREILVNKTFEWGGLQWRIPAVYFCAKGLVLDFCVEIPRERIENYYKHWNQTRRLSGLSEEDHIQMQKDNPFTIELQVAAKVNGRSLDHCRMCAVGWHPFDEEREHDEKVQEELLEYYACDRSQGWRFIRVCFPWKTSKKPKGKSISLTLEQAPTLYNGERFVTVESSEQKDYQLLHPITGKEHKLIISECKTQTLPENTFRFHDGMEYPNTFNVLTYRLSPELSMKEFMVQDCVRSDKPRTNNLNSISEMGKSACSVGIIGRASGISAIFVPGEGTQEYHWHTAYSSLHFDAVSRVEWRTMFYVKETEDMKVEIEL